MSWVYLWNTVIVRISQSFVAMQKTVLSRLEQPLFQSSLIGVYQGSLGVPWIVGIDVQSTNTKTPIFGQTDY